MNLLASAVVPHVVATAVFGLASLQVTTTTTAAAAVLDSETSVVTPYVLLDGSDIHYRLRELVDLYPDLSSLTSSQEQYGLPSVGTERDCKYDQFSLEGVQDDRYVGCKNWILTIEDALAHPTPESARALPEVFLSGALHGDERVGPTTVVETAALLLEAARCEALPRSTASHPALRDVEFEHEAERWEAEITEARRCRTALRRRGVDVHTRRWLARLVTTRRIVLLPTANALGYYRMRREEAGLDPNRDFPYDNDNDGDPTRCMRTVAARTVNEIFRDHLFQLAVTFHGGMEAVAYEWGAPAYQDSLSPDDTSQQQISQGYSNFAGESGETTTTTNNNNSNSNKHNNNYPVGTMNELVYPVHGGMEDWAYAASWDKDRVTQCKPDTYDGYPAYKTKYGPSTLRVFNTLVETSERKSPQALYLGTNENLFPTAVHTNTNNNNNKNHVQPTLRVNKGHISRNIRLALMAVDIVEPYVVVHEVAGISLSHDILPSIRRMPRSSTTTKAVRVPAYDPVVNDGLDASNLLQVHYTVGGAFTVDETQVMYARWSDLDMIFNGVTQPTQSQLDTYFHLMHDSGKKYGATKLHFTDPQSGITRWHEDSTMMAASTTQQQQAPPQRNSLNDVDDDDIDQAESRIPPGPIFTANIDISKFKEGDSIAVFALAKVDQSWGATTTTTTNEDDDDKNGTATTTRSSTPPQSHIANVRTNPSWYHAISVGGGTTTASKLTGGMVNVGKQQQRQRVIQGRLRWFSIPVTIEIGSAKSHYVELSVRSPEDGDYDYFYNGWRLLSSRTLYVLLLVGLTLGFMTARFEFWKLWEEIVSIAHTDGGGGGRSGDMPPMAHGNRKGRMLHYRDDTIEQRHTNNNNNNNSDNGVELREVRKLI